MRVIAGTARGVRLEAPKGWEVRPTLDRVREALFSMLAPGIPGARFLDLFAGTGANGIEALSRGAAACAFIENDARSIAVIERNLQAAKLSHRATVLQLRLPQGLNSSRIPPPAYDLVFADPPYDFQDYAGLLDRLAENDLVAADGTVVIEHAAKTSLPAEVSGFTLQRQKQYGATRLSLFAEPSAS